MISVDADEAARLRAAARALHGETSDDPLVALPRTGRRPATLALVTSPRCAFLDDARRCSIHGQDAQPAPCRVFPYRFVAAGDVVHVSVAHRCVCGALDRGALVSAQHADVARRLATMPLVHALPAVTAIDDDTDAPTADVLDALRRATAATGPFEILGGLASDLAALAPRRRRAHRRVRTLA
ncbi:hypothetical protein L6R52_37510, partial [Myxococcota bacterium]|nr:hypothetical protein [Myxococcota bacterium]